MEETKNNENPNAHKNLQKHSLARKQHLFLHHIKEACVSHLPLVVFILSLAHLPLTLPLRLPPIASFHHNTEVKRKYLVHLASIQHTLNYQVSIKWCTKCAENLLRRS
jgi:hypothetical protein